MIPTKRSSLLQAVFLVVAGSSAGWGEKTRSLPAVAAPTSAPPASRLSPPVAGSPRAATGATAAAGAAMISRQNATSVQSLQLPSVYAPTRPRVAAPRYPWKTNIVTTVFWIGEPSTGVTAATNVKSSWDPQWQASYGGFDDPDPGSRSWDFRPKTFEPRQNPFYIALPFNDQTNKGIAPTVIPWFARHPNRHTGGTVCKGQWLAVRFGKKTCYAQWEDCGPFETDDWGYVFGKNAQPKTMMNNGVGLDISPAVRDYLGIISGVRCDGRFCDLPEVPDGPWRKFGANNPFVKSKEQELALRIKRMEELERQRDLWLKNTYNPSLGY
jgi:hypothetical protein